MPSEKCPKCGAGLFADRPFPDGSGWADYKCHARAYYGRDRVFTRIEDKMPCLRRQVVRLKAELEIRGHEVERLRVYRREHIKEMEKWQKRAENADARADRLQAELAEAREDREAHEKQAMQFQAELAKRDEVIAEAQEWARNEDGEFHDEMLNSLRTILSRADSGEVLAVVDGTIGHTAQGTWSHSGDSMGFEIGVKAEGFLPAGVSIGDPARVTFRRRREGE